MSRDAFSPDPRDERQHDDSRNSSRSVTTRGSRLSPRDHGVPHMESCASRILAPAARQPEEHDCRSAYSLGDRAYFLRDSELQTLAEVGMFRAIADTDLGRFSYGGDTQRMEREIRHLKVQSLLTEKTLPLRRGKIRLFALTRRGARLVRSSRKIPEQQAIHHGFVKPREAKHDANLYRLYHAQIKRMERTGERPTRVVLDYELKRNLNRELAGLPRAEQTAEARERIAAGHGLSVVNEKIPVPDLRIEYETPDMERRTLDPELATRNYRPRALAEKAQAGFALCALREDASRLRRVLDEREITAEILAL